MREADRRDLELALALADVADQLTTAAFRRADLLVESKPDLTPVTEADRAVEKAIRAELERRRPGDGILGEEFGQSARAGERGGGSARRWIVDPIDGTKNFVRQIPVWATLIALEEDGVLTVGVASAPALGRRWWAGRGLGAFAGPLGFAAAGAADSAGAPHSDAAGPAAWRARGSPISVSGVSDLADAQLSAGGLAGWEAHGGAGRVLSLALRCWRDRSFGDFWSHVLVAEGACDIALDPVVSIWDLAALQVIVEEAGGCFSDLGGLARPDGGSAVSTNGRLHDAVLDVLGTRRETPG